MKNIGSVIGTFSATNETKSSMPRPKVDELKLIVDYGIENDKFANKDIDRTVMIVGINTYNLANENGMSLEFGSLGENILFDFDPHQFDIGQQFIIGETIIEITEKCTICNHLAVFGKGLPKLVKDCRGLYCKIIKGGSVKSSSITYIRE